MRIGPFGASELTVLLLSALPWAILIALVALALHALRRTARANERIADALERRPDAAPGGAPRGTPAAGVGPEASGRR